MKSKVHDTMTDDRAKKLDEIGRNAYSSIKEMVAALQLDWERLEVLRGERDDWDAEDAGLEWAAQFPDEAAELAELEAATNDCDDADTARDAISEDALSVEVRTGWYSPYDGEGAEPEEYCLLLATGGPAVRIIGELCGREPSTARLEVQDWFTPWTEYIEADQDILLAYAACFYFGE